MQIQQIWIDTDNALGAHHGDVDDGWALATLLCAAERRQTYIAGISVCNGNTDAATAYRCTRDLLAMLGANTIPLVLPGDAAVAIAALPSTSLILALGPLTNIAEALVIDPALGRRTSLITVGGVLNCWNIRRRLSDLNIYRDRQAAVIAHAAFTHCRRFPLDIIEHLTLDATRMERVASKGSLGNYLASHSQSWLRGARWRHGWWHGWWQLNKPAAFPVWDLVAAMAAMEQLPGARYNRANQLTHFDVDATWHIVENLLADNVR